jgi:hypothetical protein
MFYWKKFDVPEDEVRKIQELYRKALPTNDAFFQHLDIGIHHFLGLKVQRFVLIQAEPHAVGRIHTDFRPKGYGCKLALNIPLENCEDSTTNIWESEYTPPTQYTANGYPYNYFDPERCKLITSFKLTGPTFFRTDLPHSVDNPTDRVRRAISLRFREDPWDLIGEPHE